MVCLKEKTHKNKIVLFGIDNFCKKNVVQVNCLNQNGFVADVFTSDSLGTSRKNLPKGNELSILSKSFVGRLIQVFNYLVKNRRKIHHVELYVGGRFVFFYLLLSKLFGQKVVVVERGDISCYERYPALTKISMKFSYKCSDIVWYRELYMRDKLKIWGVKTFFFLPNCVTLPHFNKFSNKVIDFLWANRLVPGRRSDWLVSVLRDDFFSSTRNVMLGFLGGSRKYKRNELEEYVKKNKLDNLSIYNYGNLEPFYEKAKFFVFPAETVFCNNALLEAMSYGVVPLISNVQGAQLIIDDGVDGFVFEHTQKGLELAMKRALKLSEEEYMVLSSNARIKVKNNYSCKDWCCKLMKFYDEL
jgi:glycosyltransferase involved in cell wall biosynthesis